jgi:O-antigen/teichoic acid export membrane protein
LSKGVLYEFFRFAGSYQLVNYLEVVYSSLMPFAILKAFGATATGVCAVVGRVVTSATSLQEAFLPPILSGGAMVYASRSPERMRALLTKAFKVTMTLSLFPLGFIAVFGPTMAYAWTGQRDPLFRGVFWLTCTRAVFSSFSLLALVLYRTSGRAVLDNVRQVVRIGIILAVVALAHQLGLYGMLASTAAAELIGLLIMLAALNRTFHTFQAQSLLPDVARFSIAAAVILGVGSLASLIPISAGLGGRPLATLKLVEIGLACLAVAWPSLVRTGAVTAAEGRAVVTAVLPQRWKQRTHQALSAN